MKNLNLTLTFLLSLMLFNFCSKNEDRVHRGQERITTTLANGQQFSGFKSVDSGIEIDSLSVEEVLGKSLLPGVVLEVSCIIKNKIVKQKNVLGQELKNVQMVLINVTPLDEKLESRTLLFPKRINTKEELLGIFFAYNKGDLIKVPLLIYWKGFSSGEYLFKKSIDEYCVGDLDTCAPTRHMSYPKLTY